MGNAIKIIKKVKNIGEGHLNEFLGNKESIAKPRRAICLKCPLYHINNFWGWAECNSKLYLNPETNETSPTAKPGFNHGCGCRIEAKITVPGEKCPLDKW